MTGEELLKETIREKYGSVLKFSKEVQIPESSIRNIFNRGLDSVGAGVIVKICRALDLDVESLLSGQLSTRPSQGDHERYATALEQTKGLLPIPRFVQKPRLGAIACGKPILAVEEADEYDNVPEGVNCDFTLICRGESMINARIFDGDTVYIKSQPEVETGQIAAVRIGDEATLKKVYYTPGSDRITLRACNPLYPDMVYEGDALDSIQVLGLAVGFYSTVRHEQ